MCVWELHLHLTKGRPARHRHAASYGVRECVMVRDGCRINEVPYLPASFLSVQFLNAAHPLPKPKEISQSPPTDRLVLSLCKVAFFSPRRATAESAESASLQSVASHPSSCCAEHSTVVAPVSSLSPWSAAPARDILFEVCCLYSVTLFSLSPGRLTGLAAGRTKRTPSEHFIAHLRSSEQDNRQGSASRPNCLARPGLSAAAEAGQICASLRRSGFLAHLSAQPRSLLAREAIPAGCSAVVQTTPHFQRRPPIGRLGWPISSFSTSGADGGGWIAHHAAVCRTG